MRWIITALAVLLPTLAFANVPVVVEAQATRTGDTWLIEVTVEHGDIGENHYADAWDVRAPDGARLGLRQLRHPHVTEQPFTRALGGVTIPEGTGEVEIRAHDNLHSWGAPYRLTLPD